MAGEKKDVNIIPASTADSEGEFVMTADGEFDEFDGGEFIEDDEAGADTGEEDGSGHPDGQEDEPGEEDEDSEGEEGEDSEGEEDEDSEGEEDEPGEEDESGDKVTRDKRIAELIEDNKKLNQAIKDLEEKQKASTPEEVDFVVLDDKKVEAHIATLTDEAEQLRNEGKLLDAARKERELNKFLDNVEDNNQRRTAYEERQRTSPDSASNVDALTKKLEDAAAFYQKNSNIPQDQFDKMAETFMEMRKADPILEQEFQDRARVSPIGAIRWAHDLLKSNSKTQQLRDKKTNAKKKTFSGGTPPGKSMPNVAAKKAVEHATKTGTTEDWASAIAAKTRRK